MKITNVFHNAAESAELNIQIMKCRKCKTIADKKRTGKMGKRLNHQVQNSRKWSVVLRVINHCRD
jgi:hypothetical protein